MRDEIERYLREYFQARGYEVRNLGVDTGAIAWVQRFATPSGGTAHIEAEYEAQSTNQSIATELEQQALATGVRRKVKHA